MRRSPSLITLGTSGAISCQSFGSDEPESTQLLAEGRFDQWLFSAETHPLLAQREPFDLDWLSSGMRRKKRSGRKKR